MTIPDGTAVSKAIDVPNARLDNRAIATIAIDGLPTGDIQTYARITADGVVTCFIRNNTGSDLVLSDPLPVTIRVALPHIVP